MKITTLILLISIMTVSAASLAQKITLNEKHAALSEVLAKISQQSGYDVIGDATLLKQTQVSVKVTDVSVSEAMQKALEGQPLQFEVADKTIVIQPKAEPTFFEKVKQTIAAIDVTGRITDDNNQPLGGATITEKGTGNSTTSDPNGFFTLRNVQPNSTIQISYIGFDKKEISASANVGAIKLTPATSPLDEVKVIAYGKESQRYSVGSVTSVGAKDIAGQVVQNPLIALEGRVPGVIVTQATGVPGSGVTIRIQGQGSLINGNDPLIVVDGIPYPSQMLNTTVGSQGSNAGILGSSDIGGPHPRPNGSPLSYVNLDQIESISVLKDAEATSIYGSRAANGAILITTKKGTVGKQTVNIDMQQGWGKVTKTLDLLNTQQYLQMRKQAKANDKATIGSTEYDINGFWDTTRYTNWQKELIGGTAHSTHINGSLSGGANNTSYIFGGNYDRQTTVFPGDYSDRKGGMYFNLSTSSGDKRFKATLTGSYLSDLNQLPVADFTNYVNIAPDAPPVYNSDGSLNWAPTATGASSFGGNPMRFLYQLYENRSKNLIGGLDMGYHLNSSLDIKLNAGYNSLINAEFQSVPWSSIAPSSRSFTPRAANYSNSEITSWILEPQLTFNKTYKWGTLSGLLGGTVNQIQNNGSASSGSGYSSDLILRNPAGAPSLKISAVNLSTYKYNAGYARLNYRFQDKYLLNLSARRDGSSRFGPENQFHNFWSIGAGWIASDETWFKNELISFGKLRGSYGTSGNDQIGDYTYLNLYTLVNPGIPYQGGSDLIPAGLTNPYLQWEETKKLELGIDLGFWNNRVLFTANYIRNRSSNQLLSYALPAITGTTSIMTNFPATVQNRSWEFLVTINNIHGNRFNWKSNFNITLPDNKLLAFPNLSTSTYATTYIIGQPVNVQQIYHFMGVDPLTGSYLVADASGKATATPNPATDRTVLLSTNPKFFGGIQNSFSFKQFSLDFLIQFVKQKGGLGSDPSFSTSGTPPGTNGVNMTTAVLSRWQKPGDQTSIQAYNSNFTRLAALSNVLASDAALSDASYLRLKNVSLSYNVPLQMLKKSGLSRFRLFVSGQNLLTFTKFKGFDPENQSLHNLPLLKSMVIGLNSEF